MFNRPLTLALLGTSMLLAACQTDKSAPVSSTPSPPSSGASAGSGASNGATSSPTPAPSSGNGSSIPTLVNVNLQNIANDLSVSLQVNRNNIPVSAQVPISVAASVCGVSVDVLAASAANGHASCNATTTTPALTQAIQQQIASGGSVTGGAQTMGTSTTPK